MHTYQLSLPTYLLHDRQEDVRMPREIDVLVKSDDFFALLASRLDFFTQQLEAHDQLQHLTPELQKIVEDLLYLQQSYSIKKK